MARIPQDFIDTLLERTDIVPLINARVTLKKAGREYQARCPFHDEKTPSFTVSPTKQFYHCFGCGAHGSAINFLMEYDRLEFLDAVDELARQAGLEIPQQAVANQPAAQRKDPSLYEIMQQADQFYRRTLRQADAAISYLKGRQISGQTAQRFGIGFAPQGWHSLPIQNKVLGERAGLFIHRDDGGFHDRFRNRIMFPIRDTRGRTIAFGGRTLGDDKAKYLNSPETPLFHKSKNMYGLFEARQASRGLPYLLVVEGYMDVVALSQAGFTHVVATLGTATTPEHLTLLFRHTQKVIFCFDGDNAGRQAAEKAMHQSLPVMRGARQVNFLFLPDGEDPDSLIQAEDGLAQFQQAIEQAVPLSKMLMASLTEGQLTGTPEARTQIKARAKPVIKALPPDLFRGEILKEISRLTGDPAESLLAELTQDAPPAAAEPQAKLAQAIRVTRVSKSLQLLFNQPALAQQVNLELLRQSQARGIEFLIDAIEFFQNDATLSLARWLERHRHHPAFNRLQLLAAQELPGDDAQRNAQEFLDGIQNLQQQAQQQNLRKRYNQLLSLQAQRELSNAEATELRDIISRMKPA